MVVGVVPVAIVAPKGENSVPPFVMDERVPHPKNPREVQREQMEKFRLKRAENKQPDERNLSDYIVLAKNRLDNFNPHICYLA